MSGLTYAECHQEINEAPPADVLAIAQRAYARRWKGNSSSYEKQGLYATLAEQLFSRCAQAAKIIDLGCGRGEGIDALRAKMTWPGSILIGVDENLDCLAAAASRLGIVTPPSRLAREGGATREYRLKTIPGRFPSPAPVMLVHSDLLQPEDELDDALFTMAPFDAVTLWFSGVHAARQFDLDVQELGLVGDSAYRHSMEYIAMQHASSFVRAGGLLQIVGRGTSNDPTYLEEQVREEMKTLATFGSAKVLDIRLEDYTEPQAGDRIGLADPKIEIPDDCRTYATSTLFEIQARIG